MGDGVCRPGSVSVWVCMWVSGMMVFCLQCQQSMARAVATEETLGIEYDEQTTCDVCRDVSARLHVH